MSPAGAVLAGGYTQSAPWDGEADDPMPTTFLVRYRGRPIRLRTNVGAASWSSSTLCSAGGTPTTPGRRPRSRGAVGVITTGWWKVDATFWNAPDALGCFPAEYDRAKAPAVWVSPRNGDWLKDLAREGAGDGDHQDRRRLQGHPSAAASGTTWSRELPGSARDGTMVVWSAHHDAFWRGRSTTPRPSHSCSRSRRRQVMRLQAVPHLGLPDSRRRRNRARRAPTTTGCTACGGRSPGRTRTGRAASPGSSISSTRPAKVPCGYRSTPN